MASSSYSSAFEVLVLLLLFALCARAQNHEILDENIRTVRVIRGDEWAAMPVLTLRGTSTDDVLNISFDDMQHAYRRFTYRVEHCEWDWQPSDGLFESDYIDGFYDGLTIEDSEQSINTQLLYTHYSLRFPNERCRLKMSGNYRLIVSDDEENREVLRLCFMVAEEAVTMGMEMTPNTDIDNRKTHQQVSMTVRYKDGSLSVTRPREQVKAVVLQNQQWATARWQPPYTTATVYGMEWAHCRDLIFDAGNEYWKYEILSVKHPTLGIDRVSWDGEMYHVFPWPTAPSSSYISETDQNGAFLIRNSDNIENDRTTEYVYVHYAFASERPLPGEIFIDGRFTNGVYGDMNRMTYNDLTRCYEAVILQKQGYYNYTLTQRLPDGTIRHLPEDGNFWETDNSYQALIYYKGVTDRADRLVGFAEIQ